MIESVGKETVLIIVAVLFALFPSKEVAERFAIFVSTPAPEFVTTIVTVATLELLSEPKCFKKINVCLV